MVYRIVGNPARRAKVMCRISDDFSLDPKVRYGLLSFNSEKWNKSRSIFRIKPMFVKEIEEAGVEFALVYGKIVSRASCRKGISNALNVKDGSEKV